MGESVSDLNRAKIRLGEFKAVYSITSSMKVKAKVKVFVNVSNVSADDVDVNAMAMT